MIKPSTPFSKSGLLLAVTSLTLIFAAWNVLSAQALPLIAGTATLTTAPTSSLPASTPSPESTASTPLAEATLPATAAPEPTATEKGPSPHASGDCLACHGNEKMMGKLQNGELLSLYVVPVVDKSSYHTQKGIGCGFCHEDQATYPHKRASSSSCALCHSNITGGAPKSDQMVFDLPFVDVREIGLSINANCQNCHKNKFEEVKDSAHTRIMNEGNRFAPVCIDCHSGHNIITIDRITITKICSKCHTAEYTAYRTSVHGIALEKEFNHDVPTCEDCHGAHNVTGPAEGDFRAKVATETCGKCHADKGLMAKYGLSTEILTTYMDDVHGHTDVLGRVDTTSATKATCYDCHGTHNILSPKNPYSKVYPDNLQKTCQQCHKDASISFPQTWLSHNSPSQSSMPGLYFTNQFSLGAVIAVIVGIALFIILDLRQRRAAKLLTHTRRED
jgi:hypothetical protein